MCLYKIHLYFIFIRDKPKTILINLCENHKLKTCKIVIQSKYIADIIDIEGQIKNVMKNR